jgi:hypothetical protein
MKADFSRSTFDPRKHYSAVLQQQGRVQVDADWNEQQQIHAHRNERTAVDLIGPSGAPDANPGFGLAFTADGSDLTLTPGRFYVDGLLCELEAGELFSFDTNGDNIATLAVRRPELADFAAGQWVRITPDGGDEQVLRITGVDVTGGSIALTLSAAITRPPTSPNGNFGGDLQRITTYLTQPDYPAPELATAASGDAPAVLALTEGLYVAYLDVWQHHVGALDDPSIRETALGGPDTAARAKTVWQLRLLPVDAPQSGGVACGTTFPEWDALVGTGSGRLSARAAPPAGQAGPCLIPPGGGYQGLENQLYRIEIHDSGADGAATFKWSRDNGSVVTRIRAFDGSTLTVDSTGPDDALGLANGQWVEILGDVEELQGRPGQLLQITTVDPSTSRVNFSASPTPIAANLHPKMRRWDSAGALTVPTNGGDWIDLELGVQVAFTAGNYASADHWLVPARSGAIASVEWNHAQPQAPHGVSHHYARLGLVDWHGTVANSTASDCRAMFTPFAAPPPALHVTGINWLNDDVMPIEQFNTGLSLTLDGAPLNEYLIDLGSGAPTPLSLMTVNDNSMVVTMEVPMQILDATPKMPMEVVLPSRSTTWDAGTGTLKWEPSPEATAFVHSVDTTDSIVGQARVRVRLKGDAIWNDQEPQRRYLDGEVRGQAELSISRTQSLRTDLVFPSGSGRRSSDFESWFMLEFAGTPVSLSSFSVSQSLLFGSGTLTAQVLLDRVAREQVTVRVSASSSPPVGIQLNSNGDSVNVTIPPGQSSATVTVAVGAATSSAVTLTVELPQVEGSKQATFDVVVLNVDVSPGFVRLFGHESFHFAATVTAGLPLPPGVSDAVIWSCDEGHIDASGLYSAPQAIPAEPINVVVTATSVSDSSKSASADVLVVSRVSGP